MSEVGAGDADPASVSAGAEPSLSAGFMVHALKGGLEVLYGEGAAADRRTMASGSGAKRKGREDGLFRQQASFVRVVY